MPVTEPLPSEASDDWWLTVHNPDRARGADGMAGKWLVFVPVRYIDHYWTITRQAVLDGKLGPAAKVVTARPNPRQTDPTRRVIVVYTADWTDEDDVRRVLRARRGEWSRGGDRSRTPHPIRHVTTPTAPSLFGLDGTRLAPWT